MWNDILNMLILAQTAQEKRITYVGLVFLGVFLFVLFLDSMGKGKLIKSKGPLKKVILAVLIVIAIIVLSLCFIYK